VILNHGGIEDERLCQSLADKVPSAILIQPENADETKAIIAKAKACVSSRYHACISALSNGVPCLATSWSHKYQELYNEYECPSYVLEPFTDDFELDKSLGHLLNPHPIIKEGLMACSKDIQLQTQQMWKLVHKALLEYQQNR
jgi:colanic acid/amylovoran biosynthesis protein